jgi:hypothetical protein
VCVRACVGVGVRVCVCVCVCVRILHTNTHTEKRQRREGNDSRCLDTRALVAHGHWHTFAKLSALVYFLYVSTYVCMHACMCVCVCYVCVFVCLFVGVYVCINMCIRMYIYIYTYVCTYYVLTYPPIPSSPCNHMGNFQKIFFLHRERGPLFIPCLHGKLFLFFHHFRWEFSTNIFFIFLSYLIHPFCPRHVITWQKIKILFFTS